jgi:hypothetical protein
MTLAKRTSDNAECYLLPCFHGLMLLVMFSIPFGELQQVIFKGFTVAKIIVPFLLLYLFVMKSKNFRIHPLTLLLIAFIGFTLPSLISNVKYLLVLISFIGYLALFQVVCTYTGSIAAIYSLMNAYTMGLFCVTLLTFLAITAGYDFGSYFGKPLINYHYGTPIVNGTANNPNGFSSLYVVGIPIVFALFTCTDSKIKKISYFTAFVIFWILLLLTFSRSGIGASVISCIIVHHHIYSKKTISVKLTIKIFLFLILLIFASPLFYLLISYTTMDIIAPSEYKSIAFNKIISGGFRTMVLGTMVNICLEYPFFGVGPDMVRELIYSETGLYINTHNIFFGIALNYGLFALMLLIFILSVSVISFIRAVKLSKSVNSRLVSSGVLSALIGLLFHGMFHEVYIHFMFWFLIALGPVLVESVRRN